MGLCVFSDFIRALRRFRPFAFLLIYEDSTELYGWACVFSLIAQGVYGALRLALCISIDFTRVLRVSTGGLVIL